VITSNKSTLEERRYVQIERGITFLAMEQELRISALKSNPESDLAPQSSAEGQSLIKQAIEDFLGAK